MIKRFALLFIACALMACNGLGSKKTKNIVELTPKLVVDSAEPIIMSNNLSLSDHFIDNLPQNKAIALTKSSLISQPYFIDDVMYGVDAKGTVFAFDLKAKKHLWFSDITNKSSDQHYLGGGLIYNENKLYVANGSRFLIILDGASGHEVVRKKFPDIIRTKPVMLNNHLILVQTISNQLFAYDTVSTNIVWQHEGMFETLSSNNHISPVVYDGYVIVNYSSGQIFALDANTGAERWGINLSQSNEVALPGFEAVTLSCAPIVDGEYIYIASSTNKLLKLHASTGAIVWTTIASDIQSMAMFGNSLFITNNAKQIAAVSRVSGKIKWVADLGGQDKKKVKAAFLFPPFLTKKDDISILNILNSDGEIYRFQPDNQEKLSMLPVVVKTLPNIIYINFSVKDPFYLATDKQIILAK